MIDGRSDRACMSVVYEAIMIGGSGGKSAACDGGDVFSTGHDGW
jgi:hypothetical protein